LRKILALDLSSNAGFAVILDEPKPTIIHYGNVVMSRPKIAAFGAFPMCYVWAAEDVAKQCIELVRQHQPDVIAIEETNHGRASGYSQKFLEYLHFALLQGLVDMIRPDQVKYISTGDWRRTLGIKMSKDDVNNNRKARGANKVGSTAAEKKKAREAAGVSGKVTTKHLSVRYVNEHFDQKFILKDNDIADAICVGMAYLKGASVSQGQRSTHKRGCP